MVGGDCGGVGADLPVSRPIRRPTIGRNGAAHEQIFKVQYMLGDGR